MLSVLHAQDYTASTRKSTRKQAFRVLVTSVCTCTLTADGASCRYQEAFKTSEFAENWLQLVQDSADASGPQWKECHESMSMHGSILICEDSSVGSATTSEVADRGKLVCEIKIKTMKPRPEGEDSDIFFGVMSESMELDDFWFEDEFEDRVW